MDNLTTEELNALETMYARQPRDKYLPPSVAQRSSQIRALLDEVKMWRETAGEEAEATHA